MDSFLVVVRCLHNDVPLRLCRTRRDATRFARKVTEGMIHDAEKAIGYPVSKELGLVSIVVVEFHHGVPVSFRWLGIDVLA